MNIRFCTVASASLHGVEALPVNVEVSVSDGAPGILIVGMPDADVLEGRERVRCAIKAAGFAIPREKIVVNLAPNAIKKRGSGFDLPIALGILAASGQIPRNAVEGRLFAGELALDGSVRAVRGTVAYANLAKSLGCAYVGSSDSADVIGIEGVEQLGMKYLRDILESDLPTLRQTAEHASAAALDFADIAGQETAKRALQIAAAGGHGVLLVGAPGAGKSMLASRIPTILPPLKKDERLEAALARSVSGMPVSDVINSARPLRAPHHSASLAGLIGGGNPVRPGEAALAHGGVLYLDDIAEFAQAALQAIRAVVTSGEASIARTDGGVSFPARFLLAASASPCPCGSYGDPDRTCTCSASQVRRYQNRLGGALANCFEICVSVPRVTPSELLSNERGASSAQLLEGVMRARGFASKMGRGEGRALGAGEVVESCHLDDATRSLLKNVAKDRCLNGQMMLSTLRVARTIADLDESPSVSTQHIVEALSLQPSILSA